MKLDKTHIAVRERNMLEVFDLGLHVMREYARPLIIAFSLGIAPFFVLDFLLIGYMAADMQETNSFPFRFLWCITVLVFVQGPAAAVFAIQFLGGAVFAERPPLLSVVRDVWARAWHVFVHQFLIRGVLPVAVLLLLVPWGGEWNPFVEQFLMLGAVVVIAIIRATRPYMNEILLLERSPFRSDDPRIPAIAARSRTLHSTNAGDTLTRWIIGAIVAWMLVWAVYGSALFVKGVFLNDWDQGYWMVTVVWPLSLWMVSAYMAIVRFLSYLDARIRQEGWEVELVLKAEAEKMQHELK